MTDITLAPTTPIELDPQKLRAIAKAANDGHLLKTEDPIAIISQEDLEICVALLERDIREHAEGGYYEAAWDFRDFGLPFEHVNQITSEFQKRHRGFLIVTNNGTPIVTISWKKKSH
ncbi:MAG TPA: hypothetical protein VMW36_05395 [Patescibacteria group bacterium]|nr:hypothetical protein [Patescibacteria group bacterium]